MTGIKIEENFKTEDDVKVEVKTEKQDYKEGGGGGKTYTCRLCMTPFPTPNKMLVHIRLAHTVTKEFKCSKCSKMLATRAKLDNHVLVVHETRQDYKCKSCPMTFTSNHSSQRHHQAVHEKIRAHECPECDKKFFYKSDELHDPHIADEHALLFGWAKEWELAYLRHAALVVNAVIVNVVVVVVDS